MIGWRVKGMEQAKRDFKLLTLSPERRRKLLRKMTNHVVKVSRARITKQVDLSGQAFAPRKARGEKKDRQKLIQGFRRHMRVRFEGVNAIIYVAGRTWGARARQHQEGFTEAVRLRVAQEQERLVRRRRSKRATGAPGDMATKRQAVRLRELGWKKSQKWIMQTYSRALAGFLIRKEEGRTPKSMWEIVVPKREFLGANAADVAVLRQTLIDELNRAA